MDGRRARLVESSKLDELPTLTTATPPAHPTERRRPSRWIAPGPGDRLTTAWAALLGIGWPLALVISIALEPTPAEPETAAPLVVQVASLGLLAALFATIAAASRRHPAAATATAGVVTGVLALAFSVTCPMSGHHTFGLWWIGQLAVTAAMLAVSVGAFRRHSPATR